MLTIVSVRTNPEVQGLPFVALDPGDEQAQEAASSSDRLVWPVPEPQPGQQENRGDESCSERQMEIRLMVSAEAVAAKARGIPVTPPLAERQRHRLVQGDGSSTVTLPEGCHTIHCCTRSTQDKFPVWDTLWALGE